MLHRVAVSVASAGMLTQIALGFVTAPIGRRRPQPGFVGASPSGGGLRYFGIVGYGRNRVGVLMLKKVSLFFGFALLLQARVGIADESPTPPAAVLWTAKSASLAYDVNHKLHHVHGISTKVEIVAQMHGAGLRVMARTPVTSFNSGNANRDAHMLEILAANTHPTATVRIAVETLPELPVEKLISLDVQGDVELHGKRVQLPMHVTLQRHQEGTVTAIVRFDDTLSAHQIERPSLLFVPLDDAINIEAKAEMSRQP